VSLKLGFIGAGQISGAHLNGLKRLNERAGDGAERLFDLTAIADVRPETAERLAERAESVLGRRPAAYADYREMLEKERPDAVAALVPHNVHWSVAKDCLDAGAHLQMQKPIAITISEGRKIIEYAREKGKALVVSEPSVLGRGTRAVIAALRDGVIGEPTMLLDYAVTTLNGGFFMGTPWRHLKGMAGAGWFLDHGVHRTHWFLEALGSVKEAFGQAKTFEPQRKDERHGEFTVDTEDCSMTVLKFESGALGHWMVASAGHGEGFGAVKLFGTLGMTDMNGGRVRLDGQDARPWSEVAQSYRDDRIPEDAFAHSFQELHALAAEGTAPISSGERALEALAIVYACLESSETGKGIAVSDVLSGKAHAYEDAIEAARLDWPATPETAKRTS
jgi:predicted dehydrogenase